MPCCAEINMSNINKYFKKLYIIYRPILNTESRNINTLTSIFYVCDVGTVLLRRLAPIRRLLSSEASVSEWPSATGAGPDAGGSDAVPMATQSSAWTSAGCRLDRPTSASDATTTVTSATPAADARVQVDLVDGETATSAVPMCVGRRSA